jgi:hypothetical protein
MLYKDGRFAKDKVWCFFILNYSSRHTNQSSGGFFVDNFYKEGPKTLEELQEEISSGNLAWLDRICYFSNRVVGSSSYWRARRKEVFSWINYHLEQKHGPPTFFITLSCAEYHWKDIERLINDRCIKGGLDIPDWNKGRSMIINDWTVVVQEYFQECLNLWMETVGKKLMKIQYHWICFEFAPSQGLVHAHFLAICDCKDIITACHELKDNKEELALFLSQWLEDSLGMTALVQDLEGNLDIDRENHPSTIKFTSIVPEDHGKDTVMCQMKFQNHKCSAYCLRTRKHPRKSETEIEKLRRVCRCGAGVEETYNKGDTPGFSLKDKPSIENDIRGFKRVDMVRNHRRVTQSSEFLMRGWRGNCDIQFLIYESHPDSIDPADVSRVTNYVVSYACKGNETEVEEKKALKDIILAAKEEEGDDRDVKRTARRLLNECCKNRVVSKQEATSQLIGLDLYQSSETMTLISLAGNTKIGTAKQSNTTFLVKYAKREHDLHHLSLDQYFHHCFNKNTSEHSKNCKIKVPVYTGAQCDATYPATPGYARATILIHYPWHGKFHLEKDNPLLMETFYTFIKDIEKCPHSVRVSYERAKLMKLSKVEPTSKTADIDYDTFTVRPDPDLKNLVDLANTIYSNYNGDKDATGITYDYGNNYDGSERSISVSFVFFLIIRVMNSETNK